MKPPPYKVFSIFRDHYRPIPLIPVSKTPFQILVATLLSSRTRDETTAQVCRRLFKVAPSPQKLVQLEINELEILLYPVGFYKTKARHLKKLARKITHDFGGEVPHTLKQLTTLPGVGRKTANIVLARAFKIPAIGVDTHVHRIANALAWVKTKRPEQTERELKKMLPKKYWLDVNRLFVSIGQQYRSKRKLENFLKEKGLI